MSDQPPQSFTRELSPTEERDVLLNFMGNTYGEIKKIDNHIIGQSSTLKATNSEEVKRHIEQVFNEPLDRQPNVQQPQIQVQAPIVQQPQIQVQAPIIQQLDVDINQLSFNFDVNEKEELFNLVNKVLTKLDKLNRKVDEISEQIKCYQPVKKKSATQRKAVK